MSLLEILTYPNVKLRDPASALENIDGDVQAKIESMTATMYHAPGVGLAATQVGWGKSVLIYDIGNKDGERALHVLINPRIVDSEGQILSEDEGCLSLPDFRADVKRAEKVLVEAVDRDGNPLRIEAEGLHAIVLQHEIDHLSGRLCIDHISSLKRNLYKRRIQKRLRQK